MFAYSWLTSFGVAARSAEVQEQKMDDDDGALAKTKIGTFNPGQLSVVSTVASPPGSPSELDLELGPDYDDWSSDYDGPDADSLEETFPCLSALDKTHEANKSIKAWSAVGHRIASSLASCEDDTDNESVPSPTQAKVSMEAWAEVGQTFALALANCEEDDEEDRHSVKRMPQKEMHDRWKTVGDRLASVFAKAAQEEDLLDDE